MMAAASQQPPSWSTGSSTTGSSGTTQSGGFDYLKFIAWLLSALTAFAVWAFLDLRSDVKEMQRKMASKDDISDLRSEIQRELDIRATYLGKQIDTLSSDISRRSDKIDTKLESMHQDIRGSNKQNKQP